MTRVVGETAMTSISNQLQAYFQTQTCAMPEIGLLQPADPFLDTAGEDLRRRIFITTENGGKSLCLRPEFTIPVCLKHLQSGSEQGQYAYCGSVFRQRRDDAQEFTQAGMEDFGAQDKEAADLHILKHAVSALKSVGETDLKLVLGDQAIFATVLEALAIPEAWRKKLIRSFGDGELLGESLERISNGAEDRFAALPSDIRAKLECGDREAVSGWLADEMVKAGLPLTGSRTPTAISDRLFEKFELASEKLDSSQRKSLEAFLAIDVPLVDASDALAEFEAHNGIIMNGCKEALATLSDGLSGKGLVAMRYRAGFGRRLDYYTGFVFELYRSGMDKPVAGGGRYDQLMTLLGARLKIPAVGFSIWVDRLSETGK